MLSLLLLSVACVKAPGPSTASLSSSSNVWLRNSFDTDASGYVGRFVPAGAVDLDESRAMPMACSRYITARFVDGGGVRYTENFQVSTEVSARLGMPVVGSAQGKGGGARTARVEYTLTGKLVSEVADPVAFAECCKASPDQCSDRYIGEFLQGTGAVLHEASSTVGAGVKATHPTTGINGGVDVANSSEWTRAVEFPNPVYFAFKVTQTPYVQAAVSTCPAWVRSVPATSDGMMVVGQSKEVKSEAAARSGALTNAQMQVWQATGGVTADTGPAGIAVPQAREWCVEPRVSDGEPRYVGHVLLHVPQSTLDAIRAGNQAQRDALMGTVEPAPTPSAPVYVPVTSPPPPERHERHGGRMDDGPDARPAAAPPAAAGALSDAEVATLVSQVDAQSFSADKLQVLALGTTGRSLTVAQAHRLLEGLSFSKDRLTALAALRPLIRDPQSAAALMDLFSFSADREAVAAMFR